MSTLTAAKRGKLPAGKFAGPDRTYPIPDKAHAANAKARATQQVDAGNLAQSEADRIKARANAVLADTGSDAPVQAARKAKSVANETKARKIADGIMTKAGRG